MVKQILEIEVPKGKKAIWKDGRVYFENIDTMETIRTIDDAIDFLRKNEICKDILDILPRLPRCSFEWKVAAYRAVVAAITYNESRYLTTGERWYPTIEFCRPGKIINCWGTTIIGRIESKGEEFDVVGGDAASYGMITGLGCFDSDDGVSRTLPSVSFLSVSSKKVALYISKQFGKLLFEISCGGTNCDWKWI